ncbi:MAG TPA: hypothetical protein VGH38_01175, partial [Bryobacteraceae bacterium]
MRSALGWRSGIFVLAGLVVVSAAVAGDKKNKKNDPEEIDPSLTCLHPKAAGSLVYLKPEFHQVSAVHHDLPFETEFLIARLEY